jgi:hypothetical protein
VPAVPNVGAEFSWPQPPEVPGVHDLVPEVGPVPQWGWRKSAAGALQCQWSCGRCGRGAGNSSRMLEMLRTPCGDEVAGRWGTAQHSVQPRGERVECTRCGTTRQRHIELERQRCPIRIWTVDAVEQPEGTAVYAAWVKALQGMHRASRQPSASEDVQMVAAAPAEAAPVDELVHVLAEPVVLQPFRSHRIVMTGSRAWCMACFSKQPRFHINVWKTGSCKGKQPIQSCPKHVLAVISQQATAWPQAWAERGRALEAAADQCRHLAASKALRPPKRRRALSPLHQRGSTSVYV